jgi:cysteinyl-tRNA synthetase, unknown class
MMRWLVGGVALCLWSGCGSAPGPEADSRCVWNQAYQENTAPYSVEAILAGAQGCYVLIDPFEAPEAADAIPDLQAAGNTIGCYISVGTCEGWRSDFDDMAAYCTTTEWDEWPGEFFVTDTEGMLAPIKARIDRLAQQGCDMVEFDNMDWASDPEQNAAFGVELSPADAVAYYQALCDYTHEAGMACMAKSTREGGEVFDGGTFESFSDNRDWWVHEHLQSFIDEGRLAVVFHYGESDCDGVEAWYRERYGAGISFLCEDPAAGGYRR